MPPGGGSHLGFTFFEADDIGRIFIRVEYPPYYTLENTVERMHTIEERLSGLSDLNGILTTAGRSEASTGLAITILTLLGMLMLIGIVVNAAVLIVERMGQLEADGMTKRESLVVAIHDQFRPALMLILASGLGMLPIALSSGIGSENRAGMGVASVGGILVAGLFTLTVLPVITALFSRGEHSSKRMKEEKK